MGLPGPETTSRVAELERTWNICHLLEGPGRIERELA